MAGERILVVDDNPHNLKLTMRVLELAGFVVEGAIDSGDALAHIDAQQPDLILMDVQLPDLDGLTLTRELKSDPDRWGIRIVALTAFAMKGDRARAYEAGCDGYIPKPIAVSSFAAQISEILTQPSRHAGSRG